MGWGAAVFALGSGKCCGIGRLRTQKRGEPEWGWHLGEAIRTAGSDREGLEAGGAGGSTSGPVCSTLGRGRCGGPCGPPFGAWTHPKCIGGGAGQGAGRIRCSIKGPSGCRARGRSPLGCCSGPGDSWVRPGPGGRRGPAGPALTGGGAGRVWWGEEACCTFPLRVASRCPCDD